ncbi:MAG TPA: hypothetical protein DEB47_11140 [Citreicella sp.]|nr:hypothetical protein [Citreicella sp.]
MIRHMVFVRFRDEVTEREKHALYERLEGLSSRLDGLVAFQSRRNLSVELPLVRGFLDMFWIDFADRAARDAYLADAEHQAIGAEIVARLDGGAEGVFVCDLEI